LQGGDISDPGCTGKTGFLSWDAAKRAMSRDRFHPDDRFGIIRPYRCRRCSSWHIGKSAHEKKKP
jgi:hypothetical protein